MVDALRKNLMFNAEPQLRMSREDKAEFEAHVSARHKRVLREAIIAAAALMLDIALLTPFFDGFPLHRYWELGKYLLFLAFPLFLWFVMKAGAVWASWQSARETRREFEDQV